ncbi:MAG: type II toxin-antitoxin system RelE/ParE family toxin [Chitinophagales bacterium]
MIYTISFHPIALDEYKAASIWYEKQQDGLGTKFEKAIDNKIKQILHNPLAFAKNKRSYRQASIRTFPFVIVYKINSRRHEVYVSAIYHTSRNPRGKYRKP